MGTAVTLLGLHKIVMRTAAFFTIVSNRPFHVKKELSASLRVCKIFDDKIGSGHIVATSRDGKSFIVSFVIHNVHHPLIHSNLSIDMTVFMPISDLGMSNRYAQ